MIMIRRYQYGSPIQTDAVVREIPPYEGELKYLKEIRKEILHFAYTMEDNDVVYGLGENVRGINKRGGIYESKSSDEPSHLEDKRSLYAAHNFIILQGEVNFGIFVDYPRVITFDIGYTNRNQFVITPSSADLDLYIIEGESLKDIVKEFRQMIGRSYIPPKWAFGYGQSRWSYMDEDEVREVVKKHRDNQIPLDAVYLDIDYMDNYKDFTLNEKAFPNFPMFVEELKEQGIRLVPIIDAGVKVEKGYDVYEEGVENHYFCKDKEGNDFVAGVWPGKVHFPDVLNKKARKWFGQKYKFLLDQGIEGFWNDMNEPAIFYSEEHLKEVFENIDQFKGENLDIDSFFKFQELVGSINNNVNDYKRFYHNVEGEYYRHDKVHNLYGYNMTRAAAEAFEELEPEKRILLFSRSSYIGMHRYGGIWTGDNISWWSHILLNIKMMPSLNMCGFLYTGADIAGFGGNTTEDLALRWMQLGIFTPLMRNHSAIGTRYQEAYRFEKMEAFRNIIGIRYGLLPYIYSEFVKAAISNEMYFRPLAFDYTEDEFATQVEDQLLVGDGLMIAPVYQQNATGRYIYLPEPMKLFRMKSMKDMEWEIMENGHHYIDIALDEVVLFVRPNHIIPCSLSGQCIDDMNQNELTLLENVIDKATYELYHDDGFSKDFENPEHYSRIEITSDGSCKVEGNLELVIQR